MALSVNPIVTINHSTGVMIIVDSTGDYNVVTNPYGWGSPNEARSSLTAITTSVTPPGASSATLITLTGGNFDDDTIRAQDITSSLTMADGLWKFETVFTVSGDGETVVTYSFRDVSLRCAIGKLALGDMTSNDYAEIKLMYDKLLQAMACQEYTLAQDIYADILDALSSCPIDVRKGCGC